MNELEISSNWTCEDESRLKNLVTYIETETKICDIESVHPETCVCLEKEGNDDSDSKPELNIRLKNSIKEIKIFSEGYLIEVFGVHDEYLFTCIAEFVDDWEGLAVYRAKIVLPGINTCKLRFIRIKEKRRLWLYSLQLSVIRLEEPSNSLFNFENVNKLINNSSQEISEKAEKFKRFFELYAKNSNTQPYSMQNVLNIINKECNLQLSDCRRTVVECLNGSSLLSSNETLNKKESSKGNRNGMSLECQYLKDYIDRKFIEMKEDIMYNLGIKLNEFRLENNTRLDHIIKLLEGSEL